MAINDANQLWDAYYKKREEVLREPDAKKRKEQLEGAAQTMMRQLDAVDERVADAHTGARGGEQAYHRAVMESQAEYFKQVPLTQVVRLSFLETAEPGVWHGNPYMAVLFESPIAAEAEAMLYQWQQESLMRPQYFKDKDGKDLRRHDFFELRQVMPNDPHPDHVALDVSQKAQWNDSASTVVPAWPVKGIQVMASETS